jgi:uncharacterized protein YndB with AHSA1/START domain
MLTVQVTLHSTIQTVWDYWTLPLHIMQWYQASADWHAPYAENDVKTGGKFKTAMAAKDGSMSFDFEGIYTNVELFKVIEYVLADDRKVKIEFITEGNSVRLIEHFTPENENTLELQQTGWQAILNNFKTYLESSSN